MIFLRAEAGSSVDLENVSEKKQYKLRIETRNKTKYVLNYLILINAYIFNTFFLRK